MVGNMSTLTLPALARDPEPPPSRQATSLHYTLGPEFSLPHCACTVPPSLTVPPYVSYPLFPLRVSHSLTVPVLPPQPCGEGMGDSI